MNLTKAIEQQYLVFEQFLNGHGAPFRKVGEKFSFVTQLLFDAWVIDPERAIQKLHEMKETKISLQVPLLHGDSQHD
ncbi:hypothetical protein PYR78_01360 (plasmid) [Acinetobacter johnsonii]|nr:hypothetical protein PYR78_01360 [Acinetobacter johnsonii]